MIRKSDVIERLDLTESRYLLASVHREENVDREDRLRQVLASLQAVAEDQDMPMLVSTHPRTRNRIEQFGLEHGSRLILHKPLGFLDYNRLQLGAHCVVSDSGTIAEESTVLGFPAVTLRDAIERPEAIDTGSIITTGLDPDVVVDAVRMTVHQHEIDGRSVIPADYRIMDSSRRVINFIRSTVSTHHARKGIRK